MPRLSAAGIPGIHAGEDVNHPINDGLLICNLLKTPIQSPDTLKNSGS